MSCSSYVVWNEKLGDGYGCLALTNMEGRSASSWRLPVKTSDKDTNFWSLRMLPTVISIQRRARFPQLMLK
jgi:hypothetical protein